jgi:hypothetical protein
MEMSALSMKIDTTSVVKAAEDLDKFAGKSTSAAKVSTSSSQKIAQEVARATGSIAQLTSAGVRAAEAAEMAARATTGLSNSIASATPKITAQTGVVNRLVNAYDHARDALHHWGKRLSEWRTPASQAVTDMNRLTVASNDNAGAMKANVGNIAAQFQDIGVTAAMGMSPMMIAMQQGTQLAGVFAATGGNAFKTLGTAILSVISPTTILTIGLVALAAMGLQMVDWTSLAQGALTTLADLLPRVAEAAAYLGAVLALAFAPQILAAILTAISYIGTSLVAAIVAATQAMIAFSLANPFAAFVIAVGLAGAAIWAFNDDISKVLGFNVLATVKKAANYVIGAFVGAFHDIQFVWNNFPAIIGAAATGATNAVIRSINWLLEKGAAGINGLINTVNSALAMLGMGPIGNVVAPQLAEFANRAADGLAKAVSARNSQLQKDLTTDYIGAFGNAIGDAAKWAQGKIRGMAGSMGADAAKKAMGGAGGDAARAADKIKPPPPEVPIVANPTMDFPTGSLPKLPDLQPIETALSRFLKGLEAAREGVKGFFMDWINGVRQGENIFKSFGDAVINSINKIIDKLLDKMLNMLIDNLFTSLAGGMGGGGGFGAAIMSVAGSLFANGGTFGTAQKFAKGGSFTNQIYNTPTMFRFANGAAIGEMGEAGPEAVMPLKRGANGSLGVQMHGGGKPNVRMGDVIIHNSLAGAIGPDGLAAALQQSGERTVAQIRRDLQSMLQQLDQDGTLA